MKLEAQKRTAGAAVSLRQQGRLPAIVYNKNLNVPISVDLKAFDKVFRVQGMSSVIDLEVDGDTHAVLVKAVQMNKRKRLPQHVDFYAVTAGQKVDVHVRIEFLGTAVGTKEGGQLDVQRREVYLSVLPRAIPNTIELDIAGLAIGDSLHIRDLQPLLPADIEILDDLDLAVIAVVPPRVVEEETEATEEAEVTEPEVIGAEDEEDRDED
jgi:large subunit ribosomal protein L25